MEMLFVIGFMAACAVGFVYYMKQKRAAENKEWEESQSRNVEEVEPVETKEEVDNG